MTRLFALAFVLLEINFSCVHTSACEDEDEERCAEQGESETAGETETGGEDDPDDEAGPLPDLGA